MTDPIAGVAATTSTPVYRTAAVTGTTGSTSGTTGTSSSSSTGTSTTGSSSSSSSNSLLDPQAFLQLLVAQLKYQDPTNPTDTSSFMNQTAMLSQVQTMGTMSTTLSSLNSAQQVQSATSMIGKQVTYTDATGAKVSGIAQSANFASTGATLQVGGVTVAMSSIVSVASPTTTS
ncbi:flagellar basal-body rod modification protein FlgD [Jatrophihabitans endophyticus]|uniref:Flagellar basal-body rod modification protein FlgD n=1 Tax=Jatrophihabitans endophyticus TaxID=1206085 RepID=A0A1M5IG05_9ACTN|nr:flagellar hook capping FlgD N-terminal domain-containing protein [Jatrophihabitans endophyticus]SHG27166.1 flagellar basal-body rod modification protein FlgD [Jatrophihabitans endophyticus]